MWLWLPLSMLMACGPEDPDRRNRRDKPDDPNTVFSATGVAPTLEVGDGASLHHPCQPGDETRLVFGGQGGFHFEVSGDVSGLGQMVGVWVEARRLDTGEVVASNGEEPSYMVLGDYDGESGWFAGERALIFNNALVEVCPLEGLAIELCADVMPLDQSQPPIRDCVELMARLHPDDLPMCGVP